MSEIKKIDYLKAHLDRGDADTVKALYDKAIDEKFFKTFIPFFTFETNMGELSGKELLTRSEPVSFTFSRPMTLSLTKRRSLPS